MTTSSSSPGLRGRTLRSFLLLGAQKVVSVVVTAAGGIALARLLTPEVFGLYAILVFVITLGVRFSELGLGAALIQRRELELATGLSAAFTATFVLALVLGAAIVATAPLLTRWPGMTSDVTAPIRWLALLVVLASLRMPAMVLLERRLAYLPLTIAETADTVTFNVVAIAAALAGAGTVELRARRARGARGERRGALDRDPVAADPLLESARAGPGAEVRGPGPGKCPDRPRRRRRGADVRRPRGAGSRPSGT